MGVEPADLHCRSAEAGTDQKYIYVVDSCFPRASVEDRNAGRLELMILNQHSK